MAPTAASSPLVQDKNDARTKIAIAVFIFIILIMNCQSIKNKKAELHTIIDPAKPGITLGNESWLTPTLKSQKSSQNLLMQSEKTLSDAHSGVFEALSVSYSAQKPRNWTPTVKLFGPS